MRLSVIIPVYNALPYLEECLKSILPQMHADDEIILINDGSTDASGSICDKWAARHKCIKVLHQDNAGQNAARLKGLSIASGEYISFVDSDDYVSKNYFSNMLDTLMTDDNVDITISSMRRLYPGGEEINWFPKAEDMLLTREETIFELFLYRYFGWHLCGRIYRHSLFNGWQPRLDIYSGEDLLGNWFVLKKTRMVRVRPSACYYYRQHGDSVVHRLSPIQLNAAGLFRMLLEEDFWPMSKKTYEILCENYLYACISLIRSLLLESDNVNYTQARNAVHEIHRYRANIKSYYQVEKAQLDFFSSQSYEEIKMLLQNLYEQMSCSARMAIATGKHTYVYGTGLVASIYTRLIEQQGLVPEAYVISDGEIGLTTYGGKPVLHLSEVSTLKQDTSFLLAVGPRYVDEISAGLKKRGYENTWSLPAQAYGVIFEGLRRG